MKQALADSIITFRLNYVFIFCHFSTYTLFCIFPQRYFFVISIEFLYIKIILIQDFNNKDSWLLTVLSLCVFSLVKQH